MDKGYYMSCNNELPLWEKQVAIHNKNGQGLLPIGANTNGIIKDLSQSTIKMDKGYYCNVDGHTLTKEEQVAIHNKNGQGLLPEVGVREDALYHLGSQSTIKMDKGYYN